MWSNNCYKCTCSEIKDEVRAGKQLMEKVCYLLEEE